MFFIDGECCFLSEVSKKMLLTIKEGSIRLRIPPRRVRELVNQRRIAFIRTGQTQVMIPEEAIDDFIKTETVEPICHAETQAHTFNSSKSGDVTTSAGQKAVAAASAARAQRISQRRKKLLANSSPPGPGEAARVIPIKP